MTPLAADGVALGVEASRSTRLAATSPNENYVPTPVEQVRPQISKKDAVVIEYDAHGWPLTFRAPGSPAGSFPHCSWWHCALSTPG